MRGDRMGRLDYQRSHVNNLLIDMAQCHLGQQHLQPPSRKAREAIYNNDAKIGAHICVFWIFVFLSFSLVSLSCSCLMTGEGWAAHVKTLIDIAFCVTLYNCCFNTVGHLQVNQ